MSAELACKCRKQKVLKGPLLAIISKAYHTHLTFLVSLVMVGSEDEFRNGRTDTLRSLNCAVPPKEAVRQLRPLFSSLENALAGSTVLEVWLPTMSTWFFLYEAPPKDETNMRPPGRTLHGSSDRSCPAKPEPHTEQRDVLPKESRSNSRFNS